MQKLSQMYTKVSTMKLNKISQAHQYRHITQQLQKSTKTQQQKIKHFQQQLQNLQNKVNQLLYQYAYRYQKYTRQLQNKNNISNINKDNSQDDNKSKYQYYQQIQEKLNIISGTKLKEIQASYRKMTDNMVKQLEYGHSERMGKLLQQLERAKNNSQEIYKEEENMGMIVNVYKQQVHKMLDMVIKKQEEQLEGLDRYQQQSIAACNNIQKKVNMKFKLWKDKCKQKRDKTTKKLAEMLDILQI